MLQKWKTAIFILLVTASMATVSHVLAAEFDQPYTPTTLWGAGGAWWAPYDGDFSSNTYGSPGSRRTYPYGKNVRWNPTAISNIASDFWGRDVAITFHSFRKDNNGCSSFEVKHGFFITNLPAPVYRYYVRQCSGWNSHETEVRIAATATLTANHAYYGKAKYEEYTTTAYHQKFTVDTYLGGSENWHQTYCVNSGSSNSSGC